MRKAFAGAFALALLAGGTAQAQIEIVDEIVPQYMLGLADPAQRLPTVYWVSIAGLTPNATYRAVNQAVVVSPEENADGPTTTGAGNPMFFRPTTITYSTQTGLSNAAQHIEFTADADGNWSGWFGLVNSGNQRFDNTKVLAHRIRINDGAGGTSVAQYLTTSTTIEPRGFGGAAGDITPIFSTSSPFAERNIVLLYDNVAAAGRPLAATFVEARGPEGETGAAFGIQALFYADNVDTVPTAWGTVLPNDNALGVRAIVERSAATGEIVRVFTSEDGTWPSGAQTASPTGTAIQLVNPVDYPDASVLDWSVLD